MDIKPIQSLPNGASYNDSTSELSAGARLGYKLMPGLWFATDPQLGFGGKTKPSDSRDSENVSHTQVFADIGYDFSIVRTYVGYALMNEAKIGESKYTGGTAYKIGAGFKLMSNLSFNLEYFVTGFKEVTDGSGTKVTASDYYSKLEESGFLVGFGFPFEFGK